MQSHDNRGVCVLVVQTGLDHVKGKDIVAFTPNFKRCPFTECKNLVSHSLNYALGATFS